MPFPFEPRKPYRSMTLTPSPGQLANRRLLIFVLAAAGILTFLILAGQRHPTSFPQAGGSSSSSNAKSNAAAIEYSKTPIHHVTVDKETLGGGAIMPKLGNETLKAELGRAAWKLFHTTMARFPDKPTDDEKTALFSYIHLFARLYPCGECAGHFRAILDKYPPQVSGRSKAAGWACFVHNEVNFSLGKPEFDCNNIGDFYDCGCAEDDEEKKEKEDADVDKDAAAKSGNTETGSELKLEKEGMTRGG